ncbi:MAG: hypothetical protein HY332_19770 [Chloroflexi bacterium]|nr:hypothetical protein [Chloroflexota bacterium]
MSRTTIIERRAPGREAGSSGTPATTYGAAGLGAVRRMVLVAIGGVALVGLVALVAGAERLPSWNWQWAGVFAELGPGQDAPSSPEPPAPAAPGAAPAGQVASASTRYTFATYDETEAFAGRIGVHVLVPHWLPAGFVAETPSVTLSQLPLEAAKVFGRKQRVAIVQRFAAADGAGQFTLVQSLPPPIFDLLDPNRQEDEVTLASGARAQYTEYPQGVIVYWRERGDTRSVGIIGDSLAMARLTRADWLRVAESLQ